MFKPYPSGPFTSHVVGIHRSAAEDSGEVALEQEASTFQSPASPMRVPSVRARSLAARARINWDVGVLRLHGH